MMSPRFLGATPRQIVKAGMGAIMLMRGMQWMLEPLQELQADRQLPRPKPAPYLEPPKRCTHEVILPLSWDKDVVAAAGYDTGASDGYVVRCVNYVHPLGPHAEPRVGAVWNDRGELIRITPVRDLPPDVPWADGD